MAVSDVADLLEKLRRHQLIAEPQLPDVEACEAARNGDLPGLFRWLLAHNLLTRFQARQLAEGNANQLQLGPYQLLDSLGQGGMGQVFRARHNVLGREVALKIIRTERLDWPDVVTRFLKEARATGQLSHRNIVQALDAGAIDGTHYLAMELLEGADFNRLVKASGPLPVGLACECVRQAAEGLQHAFERELVHRDIKPGNLFLTREGIVKILDLGLARASGPLDGQTNLTGTGVVLGTPEYIAPEQARDPRCADVRSDLYSLGCTLYFLLTGRPPFQGDTMACMLLEHQMKEAPPLLGSRPDAPQELDALLRRLLAKKPEQRPQTPRELAAALEPFCASVDTASIASLLRQADSAFDAETTIAGGGSRHWPGRSVTLSSPRPKWSRALFVGLGIVLLGVIAMLALAMLGKDEKPDEREPRENPGRIIAGDKTPPKDDNRAWTVGEAIPKVIDKELVLEPNSSPPLLDGVVEIKPEGVLKLRRGILIRANPGAKLIVRGRLETIGDPIVFARFERRVDGKAWDGIQFLPAGDRPVDQNVSHLLVRGATVGLSFQDVPLRLLRCMIGQCGTGVQVRAGAHKCSLINLRITNNTADGLALSGKAIEVERSTLARNGGAGLSLEENCTAIITSCEIIDNDVGLRSSKGEARLEMTFCNIQNNRKAAIEVNSKNDLQCERCWWGATRANDIRALFVDGTKDAWRGKVLYDPFAPTPIKDAGARVNP
jgi:serine/threonine protein kinase